MTRAPMPDVIVLIPGVTGSVLKKDGRTVWGFSPGAMARALFSRGESLVRDLALESDDPEVEDLGDGVSAEAVLSDLHLIPGLWKIDGYSAISKAVTSRFDVTEGRNFFQFPYDWRRSNRAAARNLARETHRWLSDWRDSTGSDAKLILLAHSMGGLVSRYFLEVLEGWRDTRALVTFGTPYRGSLNALNTLANGVSVVGRDLSAISTLSRSFTSIYELLPIYRSFDPGDGELRRVGESRDIPNVDSGRAADALAFHREIERAVDTHSTEARYMSSGYGIFPIAGIGQNTFQSAEAHDGGVKMLSSYRGLDQKGDGTVPRVSATPLELSDQHREVFVATKHGSLQNADAVISHLDGLINSWYLNLGDFRAPHVDAIEFALEVGDIFETGDRVEIGIMPSGSLDALEVSIEHTETDTTVETVSLEPTSSEWTWLHVTPPSAGAFRVTVRAEGALPATDSFVVADE